MLAKTAILNQTAIGLTGKALDTYAQRSRAIANNLANVTTPGYRRIEVSFEDQVQKYLDQKELQGTRTDHNHMYHGKSVLDHLEAHTYRSDDPRLAGEINNVDVDLEMAKLAENQIAFEFGIKFVKDRMEAVTSAIKMQ